jgi:hypothetical protein
MRLVFFVFCALLLSCGLNDGKVKKTKDKIDISELERYQEKRVLMARDFADENGWITPDDCDGMIWSGKVLAVLNPGFGDIRAAEYDDEKGKFSRRPKPYCWTKDGGDQGSKTTWSKDMAIGGLIPYVLLQNDRSILSDHMSYGERKGWQMGEPLADGRAIYTPSLVGMLHRLAKKMGLKHDNFYVQVGHIWNSGLVDYKAHLQVMSIWIEGEIAGGKISAAMRQRIIEHVTREPKAVFYQVMSAIYVGDYEQAINLCSSDAFSVGSYVRCSNKDACSLSDMLFSCHLLIEHLR